MKKLFENVNGNTFKLIKEESKPLSPKSIETIEKWRKLGDREAAIKMIDYVIGQKLGGMTSADLPDTSTFADGLDEVEALLKSGNYRAALTNAIETARAMISEEGGERIFENNDLSPITNDVTQSSPSVTNPLDGLSNVVAASKVNKILANNSRGLFSDDSWQGINKVFKALSDAGINAETISAKYGGHADTESGMPKFKEWTISIPFTNKNGKPTVLYGQITAHGAGTVDQPLDRYDITAYVTAMPAKNS